jgi:hypothetical protein
MNAPVHPLAKLSAAEATLVASIDAAASRLESLGTSAVESAIERLRHAAHAASIRLQDAGSIVASIAGDVLEHVLGEAMVLGRAMNADEVNPVIGIATTETAIPTTEPATPAPVEPKNGYVHNGPVNDPDILHHLPEPEVLAKLPFLFAGQSPQNQKPLPRSNPPHVEPGWHSWMPSSTLLERQRQKRHPRQRSAKRLVQVLTHYHLHQPR